jgi:glyoxylase-like metal-dependent hydrolase (beta-lactamase superfamily II)
MLKKRYNAAIWLMFMLLCGTPIRGQEAGTVTQGSYLRARRVLERGIQSLGGLNTLRAVEDISFKASARLTEIGQSISPDASYYLRPLDLDGAIDLRGKRSYRLLKTTFIGGGQFLITIVLSEKSGFTADLRANVSYPMAAPALAAGNRAIQRTFPHLLLSAALNRASTLRWLGEGSYEGRRQQIITFADTDGSQLTFYFDEATGLLTKTEALGDTFIEGLSTTEIIFSDYRDVDNVKVPFHVITKVNGRVTSDLSYSEVKLNTHPDSALFEPPRNAEAGPEVGGPPPPVTLTPLAKDVYFVNATATPGIFFYSSMFVVFKDYVLVIEAPLSDSLSQSVIAKIKETAPGKPIKYLAPTHYHIDHLGGIRGYIAEGSTIVTTPGNRNFIEMLASVAHPFSPDTLSLHPRQPSIETFKEKRVFADGEHVVELYNLGPSPHADEIVIAYLPQEKLAFVSDLFPVNFKGQIGPVSPVFVLFEEKIRQMGLQIETIANGHGRINKMDDLRKLLSEPDKTRSN